MGFSRFMAAPAGRGSGPPTLDQDSSAPRRRRATDVCRSVVSRRLLGPPRRPDLEREAAVARGEEPERLRYRDRVLGGRWRRRGAAGVRHAVIASTMIHDCDDGCEASGPHWHPDRPIAGRCAAYHCAQVRHHGPSTGAARRAARDRRTLIRSIADDRGVPARARPEHHEHDRVSPRIVLLPGDGIGPEITAPAVELPGAWATSPSRSTGSAARRSTPTAPR